jgi:aromatic-L-amino-acid decarboxylase
MSTEPRLIESDIDSFRRTGHQLIDWIAGYLSNPDDAPVLSSVAPGQILSAFGRAADEKGKPYDQLVGEFEQKILPGVTHWNHPGFFAYFAITGSPAGILGELLMAALNVNGMLWKTSPAATELEELTLEWLRQALGLPGGLFGIINDTASVNSFLALAAARESMGLSIRAEGMTGRQLPQLRVYCSDQAHSSIDKGAFALGFGNRGLMKIESDDSFRMNPEALRRAIAADRAAGVLPCAIVATVGTTSTAAVDPLAEIGAIAQREDVWLHVDAAYAGSAAIDPAFRWIWNGVEHADSIVMNPHKWLFTPIDCSVLYVKEPDWLKETFSLVPEYLKTQKSDVINYMDYGIQLGRRFRALKLWLVLEHYGLEAIRATIRNHVSYAQRLAEELGRRPDIEILAPPAFSVVVFRKLVRSGAGDVDEEKSEKASVELLESMNSSGKLFLSHTRLRGTYGIRVAIGNAATQWSHVQRILEFL